MAETLSRQIESFSSNRSYGIQRINKNIPRILRSILLADLAAAIEACHDGLDEHRGDTALIELAERFFIDLRQLSPALFSPYALVCISMMC